VNSALGTFHFDKQTETSVKPNTKIIQRKIRFWLQPWSPPYNGLNLSCTDVDVPKLTLVVICECCNNFCLTFGHQRLFWLDCHLQHTRHLASMLITISHR